MKHQQILSCVDHTILKASATWEEVQMLCEEAIRYKVASVCLPPSYVKRVHEKYGSSLAICTVIGFPLGYNTTACKEAEIREAVQNGATELDVVVNLGDVKNGDFDKITKELTVLKKAIGDKILKVIIETCFLSEAEKQALCKCVTESGADYIKTSTGFGTDGAQLSDIELFKRYIGPGVKIKASGGIRSKEDFEAFYNAGCHRIGASAAIKVLGDS